MAKATRAGGRREAEGRGSPEGRNVAQRHDAWQAVVATALAHIVHQRAHAPVAHHQLRQLGRVLGDLAHHLGAWRRVEHTVLGLGWAAG